MLWQNFTNEIFTRKEKLTVLLSTLTTRCRHKTVLFPSQTFYKMVCLLHNINKAQSSVCLLHLCFIPHFIVFFYRIVFIQWEKPSIRGVKCTHQLLQRLCIIYISSEQNPLRLCFFSSYQSSSKKGHSISFWSVDLFSPEHALARMQS